MAACRAAATLVGTPAAQKGETLIALTDDATGCHRRRVWEALAHHGRSHRTLGRTARRWRATLRAADLDGLAPYRLPRPMEVRQVRMGPGVQQLPHDPEDDEVQAPVPVES